MCLPRGGATSHEIHTMFSPLAKRSARVLPVDLCTDHAYYIKIHRSTVLRRLLYLVIRKFIDLMSLFRHSVWFLFLLNNFPLQSLEYATYSSVLIRTAEELSYRAVFCSRNLGKLMLNCRIPCHLFEYG